MSANIVHSEHIHVMLHAFMHTGMSYGTSTYYIDEGTVVWPLPDGFEPDVRGAGRRRVNRQTADAVGWMLQDTNVESVNFRYGEGRDLPRYTYRQPRQQWSMVEILNAINGYEYQTCEHPGWRSSEARVFCEALRQQCIRALPGYDDGPWLIGPDSRPIAAHR